MKTEFPKSSIFLGFADLFSLFINLFIFRSLFLHWDIKIYAEWEWLSVWFGICLLIPRNGLEIIALRAAIRHPSHLREWTAVVLLVRATFGCVASTIFLLTGLWRNPAALGLILPLALTLMVSSISPDLAAKAQFRFLRSSLIMVSRNVSFLIFLQLYGIQSDSAVTAGWSFLSAELIVFMLWCCDSWLHQAVPGGRWRTLIQRAWKLIIVRSAEHTMTRWIRVFSWSCDALILGMIAPSIWQEIAPSRRFLMTGVISVAGWIGTLGPILTQQSVSEQRLFLRNSTITAVCIATFSSSVAYVFGSEWIGLVLALDHDSLMDSNMLALNALRFAPLVLVMLSGACLTAIQADRLVPVPGLIHLTGLFIGCLMAKWSQPSSYTFGTMIAIEYGVALVGLAFVTQVMGNHRYTRMSRFHLKEADLRVDKGGSSVPDPRIQIAIRGTKDRLVREVYR